jgi:hypothetical protein
MKISSISTGSMTFMHTSHQTSMPLSTRLRHALRSFFMKLDHIGTAIALSEANDLDGAKALLAKHAK